MTTLVKNITSAVIEESHEFKIVKVNFPMENRNRDFLARKTIIDGYTFIIVDNAAVELFDKMLVMVEGLLDTPYETYVAKENTMKYDVGFLKIVCANGVGAELFRSNSLRDETVKQLVPQQIYDKLTWTH